MTAKLGRGTACDREMRFQDPGNGVAGSDVCAAPLGHDVECVPGHLLHGSEDMIKGENLTWTKS